MNRALRAIAAMIVSAACPALASENADAWVPGVAAFGGVFTEAWQSRGDSDARIPFSGDTDLVSPFVGLSAELMAPSPVFGWGRPRPFLHGDVAIAFDSGWNTAREGSQGKVVIPVIDSDMDGIPDVQPSVQSATGTGSTARHEAEPLRLSTGLGVAFDLELLGRTLRLRPSVEYLWQQTEIRVFVSDAESIGGGVLCPCRILQLASRETLAFHGIGPGFELELDAGRLGPFATSIYGGVQGYYELGERKVKIKASDAYDDGKLANAQAIFEKDPWNFHGTIGIRLRWLPDAMYAR